MQRARLFFSRVASTVLLVEMQNWYLTQEVGRLRYEEVQREIARERFLAEHGLDLWSMLRRAIASRLPRRRVAPAEPLTVCTAEETSTSIAA